MKRSLRRRLLALGLTGLLPCQAMAQGTSTESSSSRPVRFIVPLGPGSGSDTMTRLVAKLAAKELGQPTFVENKPGADSLVAVQTLLSAPADGYNIMMLSPSSMVINPLIMDNPSYNPQRDLRPVVGMMRVVAVLVTGSASHFNSVGDVITAARQSPKSVSMATYSAHYRLGALQMQQMGSFELNQVAYRSAAPLTTDLIGGTVDVALMDIGGALPHIASGKLKALAVTSRERNARLPNIPTVAESGVSNYELYGWIGLGVSAKTPEPVARTIETALLKAVRHHEFTDYVTQIAGGEAYPASGKEVSAQVAAETARYRPLVRLLQAERN